MQHSYRIGDLERETLLTLRGATVTVAEVSPFNGTTHGTHGLAYLVGLAKGEADGLLIHNEEIGALPVTYPGIMTSTVEDYGGDWRSQIPGMHMLGRSLAPSVTSQDPLLVTFCGVVRDEVAWRSRSDGFEVRLVSDVGLLFECADGTFLLLLALDSIAPFVQVAHIPTSVQLEWWLSDDAVHKTWIFDYSPDGPELLVTRRTLVPQPIE